MAEKRVAAILASRRVHIDSHTSYLMQDISDYIDLLVPFHILIVATLYRDTQLSFAQAHTYPLLSLLGVDQNNTRPL